MLTLWLLCLRHVAWAATMPALQSPCCFCRLDMKVYLSSKCTGTPCAKIQTNLLGTKYEAILDHTVQPFIQRERTHSHDSGCYHQASAVTNPMTNSPLGSAGDLLLSRDQSWFDIPMLDSSTQRPLSSNTLPVDLLDTNASLELAPTFSDSVLRTQEVSSESRTQVISDGHQAASPHTPRQKLESAGSSSGTSRHRRGHPDPGSSHGGSQRVQGGSTPASSSSFLQRCKSGIEGTALSIMDSMNFSGGSAVMAQLEND